MTTIIKSEPDGRLRGDQLADLVRSAAAGDERGWDALVVAFDGMIWAVARAHRLRDADVADVAQATWLRLFEHLDDLKQPDRIGAWLATTARRECLHVLRCADRHVPFGDDTPDTESPEAGASEVLLVAERDRALWRSFGRLRSTDQELLRLLLIVHPRPAYEKISSALDMPIGSIGPTRARALRRLRQELDRDGTLSLIQN